ncbi:uncharacterized protein LOC117242849 [Bombus vosnesenskii]|uniref:Uncharacterized protein LOC117242849 n=1 Tax=Bombus vosnesenskii TaxID=207650 RepID=A0A6J3LJQ0_9HYME|nr:uncharacterized protein LOC117242849 [Bombus vosnesenskii]
MYENTCDAIVQYSPIIFVDLPANHSVLFTIQFSISKSTPSCVRFYISRNVSLLRNVYTGFLLQYEINKHVVGQRSIEGNWESSRKAERIARLLHIDSTTWLNSECTISVYRRNLKF